MKNNQLEQIDKKSRLHDLKKVLFISLGLFLFLILLYYFNQRTDFLKDLSEKIIIKLMK